MEVWNLSKADIQELPTLGSVEIERLEIIIVSITPTRGGLVPTDTTG
jgi:hypothetical protein